ncbi:putative peroxisomal enoyl-CoA hydratase [Mycena belliarum]|uniref:Peroxisomal enoyl-CoA hydratase n=1 Tax=Mycena belliarum TaxID=1033014 RepID=A0AAD6UM33_9AGAR|nr:putative peroxisomal enoyl-CoA hydratase [Mycena belliae]
MNQGGLAEGVGADPARTSFSMLRDVKEFQAAINAPERCVVPVIAAVAGHVLGLGIDIIAACDVRYAADDAQFSIMEVNVGIAADIGTLAHLPKITGNHSLLRELAYTAAPFSAADAAQLGLVSRVVPGGATAVTSAALALARTIAGKSPVAVAGTKRVLLHARDHTVAENLEYVAVWNAAMLHTESLAASRARRAPQFKPLRTPAKL